MSFENTRKYPHGYFFCKAHYHFPMDELLNRFVEGMRETTALEYIAVFFGIVSVILSRMENIWVYPTGLINTILYTYLCFAWWDLYAEASVNLFYTVMSIYGWFLWARPAKSGVQLTEKGNSVPRLRITWSSMKEWIFYSAFFIACWAALYFILKKYSNSTVPFADSLAGGSAYTAMLLMAKKKVESWIWWIVTNTISIPLYFYKGAVFTSFQYLVFLVLAVMGLITWIKKARAVNVSLQAELIKN